MTKTTIWTLILTLALTSAAFAATDEEKCQKKKLLALGKRDLCLQQERGKEVLGKTPDVAKCAEKFDKQITAAEKKATCRWLDNGDGTATDLDSGLQWELKTDDLSIHDKDDKYTWSDSVSVEDPDGGAFVDFLGTLNGGTSAGGSNGNLPTTGCFAETCDWRLPTVEELQGILIEPFPCGTSPCTTIPGETASTVGNFTPLYWSSSSKLQLPTGIPIIAWLVDFNDGYVGGAYKNEGIYVRAVRGGS